MHDDPNSRLATDEWVGSYFHVFLFVILPVESLNTGIHANAKETSSQVGLLIIGTVSTHKKKRVIIWFKEKDIYP